MVADLESDRVFDARVLPVEARRNGCDLGSIVISWRFGRIRHFHLLSGSSGHIFWLQQRKRQRSIRL